MGPDINRLRTELGLLPTTATTPKRVAAAGLLELQAYSKQLVPALDDYGPRRPLIGFLGLAAPTRARLGETGIPPELDAWLAAGDTPVYFGFGSMPVADPAGAMAMITDASRSLGVRALVSAGWGMLEEGYRGDSEGVKLAGAIDHQSVLARCRAAVHHGGAGTTAASLSTGLSSPASTGSSTRSWDNAPAALPRPSLRGWRRRPGSRTGRERLSRPWALLVQEADQAGRLAWLTDRAQWWLRPFPG